jgi:hypothetical protein
LPTRAPRLLFEFHHFILNSSPTIGARIDAPTMALRYCPRVSLSIRIAPYPLCIAHITALENARVSLSKECIMNEDQNQVQQWREVANEAHPAGPLFSAGIYAEADITLAGSGPTNELCTNGCTDLQGGCADAEPRDPEV